jgi:hypothetical protein
MRAKKAALVLLGMSLMRLDGALYLGYAGPKPVTHPVSSFYKLLNIARCTDA